MITIKKVSKATPETPVAPVAQTPDHLFSWQEIAAALLASKGITKGWWRVGMQMRFGALTTRMGELGQDQKSLPTAIVGVDSVALFATTQGGDMVYDAARGCEPVPAGEIAPASGASGKKVVIRKKAK